MIKIEKTSYGYKVRTNESAVSFRKELKRNKNIEGFLSSPNQFEIYTEMSEESFINLLMKHFYIADIKELY